MDAGAAATWGILMLDGMLLGVFALGVLVGRHQHRVRYPNRYTESENWGEAMVRRLLMQQFSSALSHPMSNVTLPADGGTTQIDHVLVSTKGVFVIECKNFTGWIFASSSAPEWMQTLPGRRHGPARKFPFQNPVRQNFKHVKTVQKLLDFLPPQHIHSVVVFTGDAEFKTLRPESVVLGKELAAYLQAWTADVLSPNKVHISVGRLECARREISAQTDAEHVAFLRRKYDGVA